MFVVGEFWGAAAHGTPQTCDASSRSMQQRSDASANGVSGYTTYRDHMSLLLSHAGGGGSGGADSREAKSVQQIYICKCIIILLC